MSNLKLKKVCSSSKAKFIETTSGVFNLAAGESSKFIIKDNVKNVDINPIYKTEEFVIENYVSNPSINSDFTATLDIHGPPGKYVNISQYGDFAVGRKAESLSGNSNFNYRTKRYDFDENTIGMYIPPSQYDTTYFNSLTSLDHILSGAKFSNFSEIPLNAINYDYDKGIMYADSTPMKNMYNEKYDVDAKVNFSQITLNNTRYYDKMGINADNIWASYKVGKNYTNNNILQQKLFNDNSITTDGIVYASLVSGDTVFFGGDFTQVNPNFRNHIYNIDNTNSLLNYNIQNSNNIIIDEILKIEQFNNFVYIISNSTLIKCDLNGNIIKVFNIGSIDTYYINDFLILNNKIYVVGYFTQIENMLRTNIACIDMNDNITSFSLISDGIIDYIKLSQNKICITGRFSNLNGVFHKNIGLIDENANVIDYPIYLNTSPDFLAVSGQDIFLNSFVTTFIICSSLFDYTNSLGINTNKQCIKIDNNGTYYSEFSADLSVNGVIKGMEFDNHSIYVVGKFDTINTTQRVNFAKIDNTFGTVKALSADTDDYINSISISGDSIFIGGQFTKCQNILTKNYFSIISAQNVIFDSTKYSNGFINTIYNNSYQNSIFVGGKFTSINGIERRGLFSTDLNCNLKTWNPCLSGTDVVIYALEKYNNSLIVGGYFSINNGTTKRDLLAIDTDTAVISSLNANVNTGNIIYTLKVEDDILYLGGYLTKLQFVNHKGIGTLSASNFDLLPYLPNIIGTVYSIETSGNKVFIGGDFTCSGQNSLVITDKNGTLQPFNAEISGILNDIYLKDDNIYFVGNFEISGISPRYNAACFGISDNVLKDWNPSTNGTIRNINKFDENLILGGDFTSINNKNISYLAAVDPLNGNLDTTVINKSIVDSPVYNTSFTTTNELIVDGENKATFLYYTPISTIALSGTEINILGKYTQATKLQHIDETTFLLARPYTASDGYLQNGNIQLFNNENGTFAQKQLIHAPDFQTNLYYGNTFSFNSMSGLLAVGAPGYSDNKGAVYIHKYENGLFNDGEILTHSIMLSSDLFGYSVAMYDDKLVIGAPYTGHSDPADDFYRGDGKAYFFQNINNTWELMQTLSPSEIGTGFGCSIAIYKNKLAISAPKSNYYGLVNGLVYLYDYYAPLSGYLFTQSLTATLPDYHLPMVAYLGGGINYSADLSGNLIDYSTYNNLGNRMLFYDENNLLVTSLNTSIGPMRDGLVYHYKNDGNNHWNTSQILSSLTNSMYPNKLFGSNIEFFNNDLIICSTADQDSNTSNIHQYSYDDNNWNIERMYSVENTSYLASISNNNFIYDDFVSTQSLYVQNIPEILLMEETDDSVGPIYNNYEFIERIKGVNRLGQDKLHKSNIFSIKINNSKLNNAITDTVSREQVQTSVNNVIKEVIKKITPAYTQLWKITWAGE
jgi:hypothetical protein